MCFVRELPRTLAAWVFRCQVFLHHWERTPLAGAEETPAELVGPAQSLLEQTPPPHL